MQHSLINIYVLLLPEDQSRGGITQQNAGTWKDFQATSARAKDKTNVVASQKIEVFGSYTVSSTWNLNRSLLHSKPSLARL